MEGKTRLHRYHSPKPSSLLRHLKKQLVPSTLKSLSSSSLWPLLHCLMLGSEDKTTISLLFMKKLEVGFELVVHCHCNYSVTRAYEMGMGWLKAVFYQMSSEIILFCVLIPVIPRHHQMGNEHQSYPWVLNWNGEDSRQGRLADKVVTTFSTVAFSQVHVVHLDHFQRKFK